MNNWNNWLIRINDSNYKIISTYSEDWKTWSFSTTINAKDIVINSNKYCYKFCIVEWWKTEENHFIERRHLKHYWVDSFKDFDAYLSNYNYKFLTLPWWIKIVKSRIKKTYKIYTKLPEENKVKELFEPPKKETVIALMKKMRGKDWTSDDFWKKFVKHKKLSDEELEKRKQELKKQAKNL